MLGIYKKIQGLFIFLKTTSNLLDILKEMNYILVLCENSACALVALLEGQGLKGKREISKKLREDIILISTSQANKD